MPYTDRITIQGDKSDIVLLLEMGLQRAKEKGNINRDSDFFWRSERIIEDFKMSHQWVHPAGHGGPLVEVGQTERGYTIWVQDNEVGGNRYWSDEIGGGVVVWDTCLVAPESVRFALSCEGELIRTSPVWVPVAWFWFLAFCVMFLAYAWDRVGGLFT